jgi:hypothetical protein
MRPLLYNYLDPFCLISAIHRQLLPLLVAPSALGIDISIKIEPGLQVAAPGLTMKSIPTNPMTSASQRRGPIFSPRINTDKRVIMIIPHELLCT